MGIWQIILLLLVVLSLVLPLIAIINIVKSEFRDNNSKLIWVFIVLFLPIIGSLVYFIVGPSQKLDETESMDYYSK